LSADLNTAVLWLEAQHLADTLPDRSWQALTRKTFASGAHARKRSGEGQDFWQYRALAEGESHIGVDWRKSARGDTLLQRQREQQSQQRLWLWCDMSPSMHYAGSRAVHSKATHAYLLAATLIQSATRAGEKINLLGQNIRARADMPGALTQPRAFDLAALPADATLFVLSDFLGFECAAVSAHMISLHIADPDEIDFPFEGPLRFEGLEGEAPLLTHAASTLRDAYLAARAALSARVADMSTHALLCSSAEPPAVQLMQLLERISR
jgi:uncharacterized protein (DUF58 family)